MDWAPVWACGSGLEPGVGSGPQRAVRLVCDGWSLMVEQVQRRLCCSRGSSGEGVRSVSESLITLCHPNPLSAEREKRARVCVSTCVRAHLSCLV